MERRERPNGKFPYPTSTITAAAAAGWVASWFCLGKKFFSWNERERERERESEREREEIIVSAKVVPRTNRETKQRIPPQIIFEMQKPHFGIKGSYRIFCFPCDTF